MRSYFYSFEKIDGSLDPSLEESFAYIESIVKPIIEKLDHDKEITLRERAYLSFFIALLHKRTPQFERLSNEVDEALTHSIYREVLGNPENARKIIEQAPDDSERSVEDFIRNIMNEQLGFDHHRNESLEMVGPLARELAETFFQMDWVLLIQAEQHGLLHPIIHLDCFRRTHGLRESHSVLRHLRFLN